MDELEQKVKQSEGGTVSKEKRGPGRPKGSGVTKEGVKSPEQQLADEKEVMGLVDMILALSDQYLKEQGLTPINEIQKGLLKVGLVGCVKKYGFSMAAYPEFTVLGCAAWVGIEKYSEYQAKHKKPEEIEGKND